MRRAVRRLAPDVVLVAAAAATTSIYLAKGVGFVLDDWYYLRNAELDGALHAAGSLGGDRPVGALSYVLVFGVIGPHPAVAVGLLAIGNTAVAILFRRLLVPRFGGAIALTAAGLWILLPLRTSLEAWPATGTAVLASVLAIAGARRFEPSIVSPVRAVVGTLLVVAGTLSYEAVGVLAIAVVIGLRWRREQPSYDWVVGLTVATAGALLWAFTHRLPGRRASGDLANPIVLLRANFGVGIAGSDALGTLTLVAALLGSAFVVVRGAPPLRAAVGAGWAIVVIGAAPFATYFYSPFGAGDRVNLLSAFGAALVWAALVRAAFDERRALGGVALAGLLGVGISARVDRSELWSRAGRDAERVVTALRAHEGARPERVVLGPEPIVVGGVAAFVDQSNANGAVQFAFGTRDVVGQLAYSTAAFEGARLDGATTIDLGRVSTLDELAAPYP